MRRIRIFLLTMVTVLMFAGCGSDQKTAEYETSAENLEAPADENGSGTENTETEIISSEDMEETKAASEDETESSDAGEETQEDNTMILTVNGTNLTAMMEDNSSVEALMELLAQGLLTIEMSDYANMEKAGSIGTDLPKNDEQITTSAGDLILYLGNSLVIYYAPNSWNFTRLGKIQDITADELKELLGDGDVTVTLSLPEQ
ncbi:MAG: hypothetical protein LUF27_10275 [Lachnospiraceae bacterium]|nr:hypothetical protein [Lachnospiraceae bacterium]